MSAFRLLWASNAIQELSKQLATLAVSVTAVSVVGASASSVSALTALTTAAYLIVGLPAGVLADRVSKRWLLIISDIFRACLAFSIPFAFVAGNLTIGVLAVCSLGIGLAGVISDTAQTAWVPSLVGRDKVGSAVGKLQAVDSLLQIVGPLAAGLVVAVFDSVALYSICGVLSVCSVVLVALIRSQHAEEVRVRPGMLSEIAEGFRETLTRQPLPALLLTNAIINYSAGFLMALGPVVALRRYGIDESVYVGIGSVSALAGLLVAVRASRLIDRLGTIRFLALSTSMLPLAFFILPLGAFVPGPKLVFVVLSDIVFAAALVAVAISNAVIRARVSPAGILGRVTATSRTLSTGAIPLGALTSAGLVLLFSAPVVLLLAAAFATVSVIVLWRSGLFGLREIPQAWLA